MDAEFHPRHRTKEASFLATLHPLPDFTEQITGISSRLLFGSSPIAQQWAFDRPTEAHVGCLVRRPDSSICSHKGREPNLLPLSGQAVFSASAIYHLASESNAI